MVPSRFCGLIIPGHPGWDLLDLIATWPLGVISATGYKPTKMCWNIINVINAYRIVHTCSGWWSQYACWSTNLFCLIFLLQETVDRLSSQMKSFQEKMKRVEESILSRDYKKHIQVPENKTSHDQLDGIFPPVY